MKLHYLVISIVLFSVSIASAKKIELEDGKITFEAPDEFKKLSQELLDFKFPSANAPEYVIGNKTSSTTIAYALKTTALPKEKLEEARGAITQMFPRMIPGLDWIENKIIEQDGRKWIFLEMTSTAIDTDIHNIMMFTSFKGKLLAFNFNSTKDDFKKYEKALRKSLKSIKISE